MQPRVILLGSLILSCVGQTIAQDNGDQTFATRSQNPFTRVFGLPMYPNFNTPEPERWRGALIVDVVNHADDSANATEQVSMDGETYTATATFGFGLDDQFSLGFDVPYLWNSSGRLDGFLENWHDVWGISNAKREGPRDALRIQYSKNPSLNYLMDESNSGVGDVRFWATYKFMNRNQGRSQMMTRATVKLPTGSSDKLMGSGATDFAWDLAVQHALYEGSTVVNLSAHVGLLLLGHGEVLDAMQKDHVLYGGLGVVWKTSSRLNLLMQVYSQGGYFDSDLDEVGGTTTQLTTGFRYRWPGSGLELLVSLAEDLFSDATPDVAFHFEVRRQF